jgi:hypothetical protein
MMQLRAGVILLLAMSTVACQSLSYQPSAVVGISADRLPLRVEVHDLVDVTPPGDRSRTLGGTAATASDTMVGELSTAVTDAILQNLRNDEVFEEIRRRCDDPDLVLTGTLRRFYGKSNLNALGFVSLAYVPSWYLGIPIYTSHGAVEIELALALPDGQRVGTYATSVDFSEWSSIYRQPLYGIGTRLNRAFSEAVRDLRVRMLADRAGLLGYQRLRIEPAPSETPARESGAPDDEPSEP